MGCVERPLVRSIVDILIQAVLVFGFLTVFFFTYVTSQEKKIFTKQINILVDALMEQNMLPWLQKAVETSHLSIQDAQHAINGVLGAAKIEAINSSKNDVKKVTEMNKRTEKKAFTALGIFCGCIVVALIIFKISRTCADIEVSICVSVLIVLFVGATEFLFLTIISSNYVSISPNAVRGQLADAIQAWLKTNGSTTPS